MRAIKRAQNLHDVTDLRAISRFLLEQTTDAFAYGYKGSLLARLAVAALHLQQHDIARRAMNVRRSSFATSMLPFESAALVRNLLRVHNVTDAWHVLEQELPLPLPRPPVVVVDKNYSSSHNSIESSPLAITNDDDDDDDALMRDRFKHRALAMASIISRHFFENEPWLAVQACNQLAREMGPLLHQARMTATELEMPWPRLLKAASTCQSTMRSSAVTSSSASSSSSQRTDDDQQQQQQLPCNVVYAVLNALVALPSENSSRTYELLAQALVRRTVFCTGAVSIDKCPPADRGEAAFIGRSNVGKSSLVNMVTNRKALAYVSKRPGKTRQFNYFAVNERPGYEKEIRYGDFVPGKKDQDSFYIVDLPGFGFARVPEKQRRDWATFMELYITTRVNLRVVFHLIDGRHGPTVDDAEIMQMVSQSLASSVSQKKAAVQYVIVLTKADKNAKVGSAAGKLGGKVTPRVMDSLKQVMKDSGVPSHVPVVLTSAETKLGRDEMWKYLRLAAESF
jgi:GTP-binding protein